MNKPLVLVVEDDTPVRNLITTTLKTHEYRYLSAQNGASAVLEALSHNPDIVLLDLGLPDMDGVEIIRKIRSWSNMPIIVISARTEDSDKIVALDAGADDYLTKPFSVDELLARLRVTQRSYDPKTEVMITCGGQQAILLTMKAVLEPGDEVLLPSPGYGLYYNCAAIADAQVRAYALKAPDFGWGGAEAGERTKMLFINSPHNPTGAVLSREELGQIADFAKANNLLVVSDEAYDRLLYDGLEHRSIASEPGMRDRTVILGSFSKTYSMTGWRIGYLAGPAEVIRGMALLQQSFVLSVNSFAQWGAVEAMTGPQDCVEEMRQQFDLRRKAMMEALSTIPNVSFAAPKGAFYIYLNHEKTGLDPVQFCAKLLDEYYVACVPGSEYGPYAGCNTRLSCATGLDDCLEGVDRIRKMVASL